MLAEAALPSCLPFCMCPSFSEGGVDKPTVPFGNEREPGAVKAEACWAVDGCVVRESIFAVEARDGDGVEEVRQSNIKRRGESGLSGEDNGDERLGAAMTDKGTKSTRVRGDKGHGGGPSPTGGLDRTGGV